MENFAQHLSITIFFCVFCRSGDHHFQNFFNFNPFIASHGSAAPRRPGSSGDSHFHAQNEPSSFRSPAFLSSKRLKLVPKPRIFKLKTAQARSGAPHFHARPGARSGALAHFSLCRGTNIPTKIWGEYPPPPPRRPPLYRPSGLRTTPVSLLTGARRFLITSFRRAPPEPRPKCDRVRTFQAKNTLDSLANLKFGDVRAIYNFGRR